MGSILVNGIMIGVIIGSMLTVWLREHAEPEVPWTCKCVETVELTCVKQVCTRDAKE